MSQQFDIGIIGGGIVGLATAYRLSQQYPGLKNVIIEKENRLAAHQTGHNSGVIHSGLYYKPGSTKASTAVRGAQMMIQFCEANSIPYDLCGKVVVATDESELPALDELYRRGVANGVEDLKILSREELKEIEPHAAGIRALHVPHAGIVDYAQVSEKLGEHIQLAGYQILLGSRVVSIAKNSKNWILRTPHDEIQVRFIIGCAGLFSDRVARMGRIDPMVKIVPFRGEYYKIKPDMDYLVKGLIYPVPDPRFPFLGVHFTNLIHGGVEAGPNAVLAFKREGYKKSDFNLIDTIETLIYPGFLKLAKKNWRMGFGEMKRSYCKTLFVKALQKLVPEIKSSDLMTGGSGVRAQALLPTGNLADDFMIIASAHAIHVCNAPSPAATASLSIADTIVQKAAECFNLLN
ncbi:L-2-hydroxyglutarate oxidase [bacterium]|nr:MAG: L-2-hydroxyglutarate oxidase [bacterium]